jgi:hypothetical protein
MVLLASVVVLAMALVPNRLPAWFRTGLVPLALGGLLIGLVWPYALGGIGSHIGSIAVAVGGVLLLVGGGFAVRATTTAGGTSAPANRAG